VGKSSSKLLTFLTHSLTICLYSILKDDEGNFTCIVKLPNGTEVKGHGRNKRLAKFDACRKAINFF
jgi:hypothetical protein